MPPPTPEIIRAKLLVAQARVLVEVARLKCTEIEAEMVRADNLLILALEILEPRVQELLTDAPLDGAWMPASGPHTEIIGMMLDEGSLVLEEDQGVGDGPWRVRLTKDAIKLLS
jgi:hypothetical protein